MSKEEGVARRARCHWAIFFGPGIVLAISGLMTASRTHDAGAVLVFGILWGLLSWSGYNRSGMALRSDVLEICAGFPLPRSRDIPLERIESIQFYQPALGSLLDFGKVVVADGTKSTAIRFVASPAAFVTEVRRQMGSRRIDLNPS